MARDHAFGSVSAPATTYATSTTSRFVSPDTIVLGSKTIRDTNHERSMRVRGWNWRLGSVDWPCVARRPIRGVIMDGERLPASYANFYIGNGVVLVPTFNDPNDRIALNVLAEVMPSHQIVGIHAVDLVWGLGTVHCLTQQEPLGSRPA